MGQPWKPELLLIISIVSAHCTLPACLGLTEGLDTHALPRPSGCPPAVGLGSDSSVPSSPELEMAKARNQLDAVLQCLLEKSHMDRLGPGPAWGHRESGALGGTPEAGLGRKGPNG